MRARRKRTHCPYREEGSELEATEQDAAIQCRNRDRLPAFARGRLAIATIVVEDDLRRGRLVHELCAVFQWNLLGPRRGFALLALAARTTATSPLLWVGVAWLAARVGGLGRHGGRGQFRATTAAVRSGRIALFGNRPIGVRRARARGGIQPLQRQQGSQQPDERSRSEGEAIHEQPSNCSFAGPIAKTIHRPYRPHDDST